MLQMSPLVHRSIDKLMDLFHQRAEAGCGFDIFMSVASFSRLLGISLFDASRCVGNREILP